MQFAVVLAVSVTQCCWKASMELGDPLTTIQGIIIFKGCCILG